MILVLGGSRESLTEVKICNLSLGAMPGVLNTNTISISDGTKQVPLTASHDASC